jgi:hypothetical protein
MSESIALGNVEGRVSVLSLSGTSALYACISGTDFAVLLRNIGFISLARHGQFVVGSLPSIPA